MVSVLGPSGGQCTGSLRWSVYWVPQVVSVLSPSGGQCTESLRWSVY